MTGLTESEARTRWCPFARSLSVVAPTGDNAAATNRDGGRADPWCHCLASECMAWRWDPFEATSAAGSPRRGHCGLAGMP